MKKTCFSLYGLEESSLLCSNKSIEIKKKLKTILERYTEYKELYSIGDEDSYVYGDRFNEVVIKCIQEPPFLDGSDACKLFMNDNRSYLPKEQEENEITLSKYAFENPKENWFEVKDLFYIVTRRKIPPQCIALNQPSKEITILTPWFCVVTKSYSHTFLSFSKVLSNREKIRILYGLVSGLHDLHRLGYCHGDLKPPNICIDDALKTKLIDFGTAMSISQSNYLYSWKNSFAYFTPRQCYAHLQYNFWPSDSQQINVLEIIQQFKYSLQSYNITFIQDDYNLCEEHGIYNDLFVVGILIGEWFTEGVHFFYRKQIDKKLYNSIIDREFVTTISSSVLKFIVQPREYIDDYYKMTSFPEFVKPVFEFCLSGWNNTTRQVEASYTYQLMMLISNIDLKE